MRPYYKQGNIIIYLGDCREILPGLEIPNPFVIADPPYGKKEATNRATKGRGGATEALDFPAIYGDDQPFDPSHLLHFPKLVLWGANYYADKLPPSPNWLVWDKRDGVISDDNADCELAWTNLPGPARLFRHLWKGMIKASERTSTREHPSQKPTVLMSWIIERFGKPGETMVDPYMGSGPVIKAARMLQIPAIGIEYEERYCENVVRYLQQPLLLDAAPPVQQPEQPTFKWMVE